MLLGAVGAYDWNGTVVMQTAKRAIVPGKNQFYDPKTEAGYEGLAGYHGEWTLVLNQSPSCVTHRKSFL